MSLFITFLSSRNDDWSEIPLELQFVSQKVDMKALIFQGFTLSVIASTILFPLEQVSAQPLNARQAPEINVFGVTPPDTDSTALSVGPDGQPIILSPIPLEPTAPSVPKPTPAPIPECRIARDKLDELDALSGSDKRFSHLLLLEACSGIAAKCKDGSAGFFGSESCYKYNLECSVFFKTLPLDYIPCD